MVNFVSGEFHLNFLNVIFTKSNVLGTVLGILKPYHEMGPVYENPKF